MGDEGCQKKDGYVAPVVGESQYLQSHNLIECRKQEFVCFNMNHRDDLTVLTHP